MRRSSELTVVGLIGIACLVLACTDEGEADTTGPGGSDPSTGGAGAGTTEGGGGAAGGGGQGGEGGDAPSNCLAAASFEDAFTIEAGGLCVVDVYTADGLELASYGTSPTWGTHGGPLTVSSTATGFVLQRWSEGDAGELTAADEEITFTLPASSFLGPMAVDVAAPADGACAAGTVTVVAWTGMNVATEGEIVTVAEGAATGETTTGVFGLATVDGRIFYTGTSAVGGPTDDTLALYAADARAACEDPGFDAAVSVDTWGLASGPAAVDSDGNLFAILTDYVEGTQEIRGFAAASVASTTAPVEGDLVGTTDGFGDALAAVAPAGEDPGLVVMQANAGRAFAHGDVLGFTYTLDAGEITAGDEAVILDLVAEDQNVVLFTDDGGRLWVGVSEGTGAEAVATFYVLTRAD